MATQYISRSEGLKLMRQLDRDGFAKPFSIEWVTCDRQRNTGGEVRFAPKATLSVTERKRVEELESPKTKRAAHYFNQTRNIKLPNGDIKKVHIQLITKINGYTLV